MSDTPRVVYVKHKINGELRELVVRICASCGTHYASNSYSVCPSTPCELSRSRAHADEQRRLAEVQVDDTFTTWPRSAQGGMGMVSTCLACSGLVRVPDKKYHFAWHKRHKTQRRDS